MRLEDGHAELRAAYEDAECSDAPTFVPSDMSPSQRFGDNHSYDE